MPLTLRETGPHDAAAIAAIHHAAFDGPAEAALAAALLADPSAAPRVSILAKRDRAPVGHALFTAARLGAAWAGLLCPLAVSPPAQRRGVGAALIADGLAALAAQGCVAALVFGDPVYYGRFGFRPAARWSVTPPHPPQPAWAHAFMLRPLQDAAPPAGRLAVADALDDPALWVV